MRRSVVALAGLVVVLGYVRRRADPDVRVDAELPTATAGVRMITPATHVTVVTPPSPLAAAPRTAPMLDLIVPDQDPPLPAAPPRAIHGRLLEINGDGAIGATVVVTSPNLEGEQVVITDEDGYFRITSLPVGEYVMTVYYNNRTFSHASLDVNDQEATVVGDVLDPSDDAPQTIEVVTVNSEYGHNIPVPGRTFEAVLGVAAGSQVDSYGVALTGVTTLENVYVVDEANDDEQPPPVEVEPTRLEAPVEGDINHGM